MAESGDRVMFLSSFETDRGWQPNPLITVDFELNRQYVDTPYSEVPRESFRSLDNEIHDYLMGYQVVVNPLTGQTTDPACYGSTVMYHRLSRAIYDQPDVRWDVFCEVQWVDAYLSPGIGVLASLTYYESNRLKVRHPGRRVEPADEAESGKVE